MSSPTKRQPPTRLAKNLKSHRQRLGLSFAQVAVKVGVTKGAAHGWERGAEPGRETLERLAELYETSVQALRYDGDPDVALARGITERTDLVSEFRSTYGRDPFLPNPALRLRLRPAPYARVYEHLQRMIDAKCDVEQIELAERTMMEGAFNKINKTDPRDRTDAEMILDIDAAWIFIKSMLDRAGAKGL